jgi:DNA-binding transcriptional MerR regulator
MTATTSDAASVASTPRPEHPYRMRDLCELTGLERQAIHFYIQQGLVPAGKKTGRNMAWYGPEHVERLQLIRRLQEERFLPLKAIKAMLDGHQEHFTRAQQGFLRELKRELATTIARGVDQRRETVDVSEQLAELGIEPDELAAMVDLGILGATLDGSSARVAREDVWMLETIATMRQAGLSKTLGFEVSDLRAYTDAMDALVQRDGDLISERLAHLPPEVVARIMERMMPLILDFMARYYASRVRHLLAAM